MRTIRIVTIIGFVLLFTSMGLSQTISNYLILQGIGNYHNSGKGKCANGSGIIAATGHFKIDHNDLTCRTGYYNTQQDIAISVQVTRHAGSDSDRWLLHEAERGFRDSNKLEANPAEDTMIRELNNNKIYFYGGGVVGYRWISNNNIVINIQYTNLSGPKSEPIEVVNAYLAKFPSIITLTDNELHTKTHDEQWIKDEMERRLWLCDKWFVQLESDRSKLSSILKTVVDHISVFLAYREKYFGVSGKDDASALMRYLTAKDETSLKNKLAGYKAWWNINKTKSINLP